MTQVFLSYARSDGKQAARLYRDLKRQVNHDIWYDKTSLQPGVRWQPAIRKAIRESRYFLALLSGSSVSERGTRHSELRQALDVLAEFPSNQTYLIPVRLDDCQMPDAELDELHRVDLFPRWGAGVESIVQTIGAARPKASRPASTGTNTQFRVALLGQGVAERALRTLAAGLNSVQDFFVFSVPPSTAFRIATTKALQEEAGAPHFVVDNVDQTFFAESRFLAVDLIACFTDRPLAFTEDGQYFWNYFAFATGPQERFLFLSADILPNVTESLGQTLVDGLAYVLVGILINFFTDTGYHGPTWACPMDHCGQRADIRFGLAKRRLCAQCSKAIKTPGLRTAVNAILNWRAD